MVRRRPLTMLTDVISAEGPRTSLRLPGVNCVILPSPHVVIASEPAKHGVSPICVLSLGDETRTDSW